MFLASNAGNSKFLYQTLGHYPALLFHMYSSRLLGYDIIFFSVNILVFSLGRVGKCRGYGGYIRVNFLETWGNFFESNIRAYDAA